MRSTLLSRTALATVFALALLGASQGLSAQHQMLALPAPNDPAPLGRWYGAGCGGHLGAATVRVVPSMRPGRTSRLMLDHLPPGMPTLLLIGTNAHQFGGVPLPQSLASIGMPGCELLLAPELAYAMSSGPGTVQGPLPVPNVSALAGQALYFQSFFQRPFQQSTSLPGGVGASRGYATRIAPMPTGTSMVSSIAQHGVTFTFEHAVEAGRFVNGDWFVIGPVTVVGMAPASGMVNGRVVHGAMVDPDPSTQDHGYDSTLFDPQNYSHARNVAWGLSPAAPLVLGGGHSLIKSVSNLNPNLMPALETCAVLTVLDEVPPAGSFRPAYAGADREVRFDEQMIDWSVLASLQPMPGMRPVSTMLPRFERPWLDHAPGWATRFLHPALNMPDYGRDLASDYNEAALMCNTNLSDEDRRALAIHLVQIGIDFHGNVRGGAFWEGVGGHGSGRKLPILFAGALLGDEQMLSVGVEFPSGRAPDGTYTTVFGEDCQTFFVQQTGPNEINWGYGGYQQGHVGMAEFGFSHTHYPVNDDVSWTGNSYRQCCTANAWIGGVLCARIMGLVDRWHHPALFAYTDRFAVIEPSGWTRSWSPWVGDMWDAYRPLY